MSWSSRWVGTSDAIKRGLDRFEETQTGSSKTEFQAAKPGLVSLLDQNTDWNVLRLQASGHAYMQGDERRSQVTASLEVIGKLEE